MDGEVRRWVIGVNEETAQEEILAGPGFDPDEPVTVLDANAVADLLERWMEYRPREGELGVQKRIDTEALLQALGRQP